MPLIVPNVIISESVRRVCHPRMLPAKKTGIMASQGERVSIKKREVAVALSEDSFFKE